MITKRISEEVKKNLVGIDQDKMNDMILKHYKLLHLVDDKGTWATPKLQEISQLNSNDTPYWVVMLRPTVLDALCLN
jgi:hypothetical protein